MKVLMICCQPPWPPLGGAPLRSWGWLRAAAKTTRMGLIALQKLPPAHSEHTPLGQHCEFLRQVHVPPGRGQRFRDLVQAWLRRIPYQVQACSAQAMTKAVRSALDHWQPDIVQAEWIGAAPYLRWAVSNRVPTLYAAHNIEHRVIGDYPVRWRRHRLGPFSADSMRRIEINIAHRADGIVTVTEKDRDWFLQTNHQVQCIPNALNLADYDYHSPGDRASGPVVFIGHLQYPPNQAAAEELLTRTFPLLRRQRPDTHCLVAGMRPSRRLRRLAGEGIAVHGDVADMSGLWNRAAALLCPLESGGGSRLKLLEAAACGVPIIASRFSAQGLALEPGRDFVPAENPEEMAAACLDHLADPERWQAMAQQARKTVELHHNWEMATTSIQSLYETLADHHR